eukprot:sb/3461508/
MPRVLAHMEKCTITSPFTSPFPKCSGTGSTCYKRKDGTKNVHYHCTKCSSSHVSQQRISDHIKTCTGLNTAENETASQNVQLVCHVSSVYLVRKQHRGPAAPVHVYVDSSGSASRCEKCYDPVKSNEGRLCEHIEACLDYTTPSSVDDLISSASDFSQFSNGDKLAEYCSSLQGDGIVVCSSYIPKIDSQCFYFSIAEKDIHHYSRLNRVLVTQNRENGRMSCACRAKEAQCIHKRLATIALAENHSELPDCTVSSVQAIPAQIEECSRQVKYLVDYKQFPPMGECVAPQTINSFVPKEDTCVYCSVALQNHKTHSHGVIFVLNKDRKKNVSVSTKICPSCQLVFRYSEHSDGYFNFNNTAFFSIQLLELAVNFWLEGTPISKVWSSITKTNIDLCNSKLLLNAVKAYISIIDMDICNSMFCYQCGYYPPLLTYDTVRKTCFDLKTKDLRPSSENYKSFQDLLVDARKYDLARCFLPKNIHYQANLNNFRVRLTPSFPPLICPKNMGTLHESTRDEVINERPRDKISFCQLEEIVKSSDSRQQLTKLCKKFKIDTAGGKSHMIEKLSKHCEVSSNSSDKICNEIYKNFFSYPGKSGGILRGYCPHGALYAIKFLSYPESVADYTQVMTYFKTPPTINNSDMASKIAKHTNLHYPEFFNPHCGAIGDDKDPESVLYKTGKKIFEFDMSLSKKKGTGVTDSDDPYPVFSMYDCFHQHNHKEKNRHLRSLDSTSLKGCVNSSVVEQQNSLIERLNTSANQMFIETHIKFVSLYNLMKNKELNKKWKDSQKKKARGCEFITDTLTGILTPVNTIATEQTGASSRQSHFQMHPTNQLPVLLGNSASGRLRLTEIQKRILESRTTYDDIVINSYANMCLNSTQSHVHFQDVNNSSTSGPYFNAGGSNFVQILNVDSPAISAISDDSKHCLIVSNVLCNPETVQIFDPHHILRDDFELSEHISKCVLQLQPSTQTVELMKSQICTIQLSTGSVAGVSLDQVEGDAVTFSFEMRSGREHNTRDRAIWEFACTVGAHEREQPAKTILNQSYQFGV